MFQSCYEKSENGIHFIAWPDGKSLLEQEACVVECFRILKNVYIKEIKKSGECS